jgi:hypothetical protein
LALNGLYVVNPALLILVIVPDQVQFVPHQDRSVKIASVTDLNQFVVHFVRQNEGTVVGLKNVFDGVHSGFSFPFLYFFLSEWLL